MTAEFPCMSHFPWGRQPPAELCVFDRNQIIKDGVQGDSQEGRNPYPVNGLPVSSKALGCCPQNLCECRSDVIFYDGIPYDQKPVLSGRLRRRPNDVMYYEGKLIPPFGPGKSVNPDGYHSKKDKYQATITPYVDMTAMAYTSMGLPYGHTLGYFRFKPDKLCDCRPIPLQRLGECCTCEPGEYNPAQYITDECPPRLCCC